MERALRFSAFRNIGFKDGKPDTERLILSNSLNKGELGDLVIVIGPNNAGKSNVLEGISAFGKGECGQRDVTDLYPEEECRHPSLTLSYKSDDGNEEYSLKKGLHGNPSADFPGSKEYLENFELKSTTKANIFNAIDNLRNFECNYYLDISFFGEIKKNHPKPENPDDMPDADFKEIMKECFEACETFERTSCRTISISNPIYSDYKLNCGKNKRLQTKLKENFSNKYGYDFEGEITVYNPRNLTNRDLTSEYTNLADNHFFRALFKAIDVDVSKIDNVYRTFRSQQNKGQLKQLAIELNSKMKTISDKFNELYYLKDTPYSFDIDFESAKVFFSIFRGGQSLSLDNQSAGFKWFFDLYFNLINTTDLKPGDIIIMDEPATNLHPKGQKELRNLLKNFAIRNDITFVIATHSPFLIDLDYLDELRIVENRNNVTSIANNFAAVNPDDPDSLLPIKESLTIENHVICDPDKNVVFVEGITDYNYLTAFKKVLGVNDIYFLPINGIGRNKDTNEKISKRLIEIRRHNPVLLVDNDASGKNMESINKSDSELKVISLGDVNPDFKTIESLFTDEDLKKFGLIDSKGKFIKHASTSTLFKNKVLKNKDEVSDKTKENFKSLFEKLTE